MKRAIIAIVAALFIAPAAAQTPWRDPLNRFTVTLPEGWSVRELAGGDAWFLSGGGNVEEEGACRVNQNLRADLPIASSALDALARNPAFVNATIQGLLGGLENVSPRIIAIAGPNRPPVITMTLLTSSGRRCTPGERCGRMAVTVQMMVRPGTAWSIMCRVIEERMRAVEPRLGAIVDSWEVGETYGAMNILDAPAAVAGGGPADAAKDGAAPARRATQVRADNLFDPEFVAGSAAYQRGDYDAALRTFRRLAEAGHVGSQNNMAAMYEQGHGVPRDDLQALMWWIITAQRAAAAGPLRRLVEESRDRLAARLTQAQVAEAEQRARAWDAAHPAAER